MTITRTSQPLHTGSPRIVVLIALVLFAAVIPVASAAKRSDSTPVAHGQSLSTTESSAARPSGASPSSSSTVDGCVDDELEDNDSISAPTPLISGADVSGTLCPLGESYDPDFFQISAESGQQLEIDISTALPEGGVAHNVEAFIAGPDGTRLADIVQIGDERSRARYTVGETSTYFIVIAGALEREGFNYHLTVAIAVCDEDGLEDNDTMSQGTELVNGQAVSGHLCSPDADYFRVPVLAHQLIHASLSYRDGNEETDDFDYLHMQLLDSSGNVIREGSGRIGEEDLQFIPAEDGTYYVRLEGLPGFFPEGTPQSVDAAYELRVDVGGLVELEVGQVASITKVEPGGVFAYELSVTNPSETAAVRDVLLTQQLPQDQPLPKGVEYDFLQENPDCGPVSSGGQFFVLDTFQCLVDEIGPGETYRSTAIVSVGDDFVTDLHTVAEARGLVLNQPGSDPPPDNSSELVLLTVCQRVGSPGRDRIVGSEGSEVICAAGGNDVVIARGGNDRVLGGSGEDQLDGGKGNDVLVGGSGADRAFGGVGNDEIYGDIRLGAIFPSVWSHSPDRLDGGQGVDSCGQNEFDDSDAKKHCET